MNRSFQVLFLTTKVTVLLSSFIVRYIRFAAGIVVDVSVKILYFLFCELELKQKKKHINTKSINHSLHAHCNIVNGLNSGVSVVRIIYMIVRMSVVLRRTVVGDLQLLVTNNS